MKGIVLGMALVLGFAVAASAQSAGEKVYAEQKCAMCHSIAGKGNAKGVLDGVGTKYSEADLKAWIVDAKGMTAKTKAARTPAMKNYTLKDDEVKALVDYMKTLKK